MTRFGSSKLTAVVLAGLLAGLGACSGEAVAPAGLMISQVGTYVETRSSAELSYGVYEYGDVLFEGDILLSTYATGLKLAEPEFTDGETVIRVQNRPESLHPDPDSHAFHIYTCVMPGACMSGMIYRFTVEDGEIEMADVVGFWMNRRRPDDS